MSDHKRSRPVEIISKQHQPELETIAEAARRKGVSHETVRRRVLAGELKSYQNNCDRRQRLVSVEEVNRVFEPTLIDIAA
jgi:excisionase family DNA binding protein